jgi:hypothetical protein
MYSFLFAFGGSPKNEPVLKNSGEQYFPATMGCLLLKTIAVDILAKCEEKNVNNNNFTIVFQDLHTIVNNFTTTRPIFDIKG